MLKSMNPTEITSGDLKQIVKLLAERKMLVGRLEEVDRRLAGYDGAASQPAARLGRQAGATVARKVRAPRRGQRRKLKETILEFVHKAGAKGVTVQAIAGRVGVHPNRIHTWFYNTGKRLKTLKKVAPATYRWQS
jgi:hypothetical protein